MQTAKVAIGKYTNLTLSRIVLELGDETKYMNIHRESRLKESANNLRMNSTCYVFLAEEVAKSGGGDGYSSEGRRGDCGAGGGSRGGRVGCGGRADEGGGHDHGRRGHDEDLGLQLPCHPFPIASVD